MPRSFARITPQITVDERIVYRLKAVGPGSVLASSDGRHADVAGRIDGTVGVQIPLHPRRADPSPMASGAADRPDDDRAIVGPVDRAAMDAIRRAARRRRTLRQHARRLLGPIGLTGPADDAGVLRVGWLVPQTKGTGKPNDPRGAAARAIGLDARGAAPIDVTIPAGLGAPDDNSAVELTAPWSVQHFDPRQLRVEVRTSILSGREGALLDAEEFADAPVETGPRSRDDRLCIQVRIGRLAGLGDTSIPDHGWAVTRVEVDWPSRRHDPIGTARLRVVGRNARVAGMPPLGLARHPAGRAGQTSIGRSVRWRTEPRQLVRDEKDGMACAMLLLPLDAYSALSPSEARRTPRVAMELVPTALDDRCVSGVSLRAIDAAGRALPRSIVQHRSTVDLEFEVDLPAVARDRSLPVRRRLQMGGLQPSFGMLERIDNALAGAGMHLPARRVLLAAPGAAARTLAVDSAEATSLVVAGDAMRHLAPGERLSVEFLGTWPVAGFTVRELRVELIVEAAASPTGTSTPLHQVALVMEARHPDPLTTGRALDAVIETVHDRLVVTAGSAP